MKIGGQATHGLRLSKKALSPIKIGGLLGNSRGNSTPRRLYNGQDGRKLGPTNSRVSLMSHQKESNSFETDELQGIGQPSTLMEMGYETEKTDLGSTKKGKETGNSVEMISGENPELNKPPKEETNYLEEREVSGCALMDQDIVTTVELGH